MVEPKKKRTDLAVPAFVASEWKKGTEARDAMAETLQAVNWDKDT